MTSSPTKPVPEKSPSPSNSEMSEEQAAKSENLYTAIRRSVEKHGAVDLPPHPDSPAREPPEFGQSAENEPQSGT